MAELYGAELHFEESLINWESVDVSGSEPLIKITTTKAAYLTKKMVLSVGPWAPAIYGSEIPLPLVAERRVLYWFEVIESQILVLFSNIII